MELSNAFDAILQECLYGATGTGEDHVCDCALYHCADVGADVTTDEIGNVIIDRTDGNGQSALLSAHMDRHPMGRGYDDCVGVAMILSLVKHSAAPFKALLTVGEEIGGEGIKAADPSLYDNVSAAIVLDRHGAHDMIDRTGDGRTCPLSIAVALTTLCADIGYPYVRTRGNYSDVVQIAKHVPAVNLSVGYYAEHTEEEGLDLATARMVCAVVDRLVSRQDEWATPKRDHQILITKGGE